MLQQGTADRAALAPVSAPVLPERRLILFCRGVLATLVLAAFTVIGAIGAFLALLPAALQRGPRGRAVAAAPPPVARVPEAGSSQEALPG